MLIERQLYFWTEDEDNYIKENYMKMSDKEMANNLPNRSERSVRTRRNIYKLIRPKSRVKKECINVGRNKVTFSDVQNLFKEKGYELLSTSDEYQNQGSKLRYICPKHKNMGELTISYGHLKDGRGCKYCGRESTAKKRSSKITPDVIETDKYLCEVHNFEYLDTEKVNGKYHIRFICNNHKDLGPQLMTRGNMNRDEIKGCQYCCGKNYPSWYIKQEIETKYPEYEVISEYSGMNKTLKCYCKLHKLEFEHDAKYILYEGQGCSECSHIRRSNAFRLSNEEIIERVHEANPDIEIADINTYKSFYDSLLFRCKKCGEEWYSTFGNLTINKSRCPYCSRNISKGEEKIISYMQKAKLNYYPQYAFPDCKYKNPLKFDMAILDSDDQLLGLVEYQGEQHYTPVKYFGGEEQLKENKLRDSIKREYCVQNNIPLLEIPYWEYDNVDLILEEFIKKIA